MRRDKESGLGLDEPRRTDHARTRTSKSLATFAEANRECCLLPDGCAGHAVHTTRLRLSKDKAWPRQRHFKICNLCGEHLQRLGRVALVFAPRRWATPR